MTDAGAIRSELAGDWELPRSLDDALRADITVHNWWYEYRGGAVSVKVQVDGDGQYRAVVAEAYRDYDEEMGGAGERLDYVVSGTSLEPTALQKAWARISDYEYEAIPETAQVVLACEEMEAAIDEVRGAEARHEECMMREAINEVREAEDPDE